MTTPVKYKALSRVFAPIGPGLKECKVYEEGQTFMSDPDLRGSCIECLTPDKPKRKTRAKEEPETEFGGESSEQEE